MKKYFFGAGVISLLAFLAILLAPITSSAQVSEDHEAFVGVIERIEPASKTIYVKSEDGVVKAFKWTGKTIAHGIKKASIWTDRAAHVGAHVVIRSIKVAGEETIYGINWFGHGTVKVLKGTVKHVGKGSKKVAVAVAGEGEEIYDVSEHAIVRSGKKVAHGEKEVEKVAAKKVSATVHVFEGGGKKFVHFFHHHLDDEKP